MNNMKSTELTAEESTNEFDGNGFAPLIRLTGVTKVFLTDEVETHALSGIHLDIREGEYISIAGPSGCGKTTLLSILGLLDTASDGSYALKGHEVVNLSFAERARVRNREIGFIFQSFNLIGDLTVFENVELPLTYRGTGASDRKALVTESLERVGMAHRAKHLPSQLSGGQQQRVAVARALAGRPAILLADEPTGNLDSHNGEAVMHLLRELHQGGATIAAVTVLALGIGVNTAVFSLVNTLFFAPPAYAKPHEMVQLFSQDKKDPKKFRGFSYPTYVDVREQNTVFTDVMSFNLALIGIGQKGDTRRGFAGIVSSNYFSVLGVPVARGRAFVPEEEAPGHNTPVAIVSYSYWQKHDLDPNVLGSQLLINGRSFTIVGVTPKGFVGTMQILSPEVWLPMSVYDQVVNDFESENKTTIEDRKGTQLRIMGRLKPAMTASAAKPALEGLAANLEKAYPVGQKDQTFMAT